MALFSGKNRKNGAPAKATPPIQTRSSDARQQITESKPAGDHVSEAAIRARAHQIWLARGGAPGDELSDWLLARQELESMEESSGRSASSGGTT